MALALYGVLKQSNHTRAVIGATFAFVGMAVYLATNVAFPMLFLSHQYTTATAEAQKSIILAAGQAMIAVTEGARMFPLIPLAGLILSASMLRSEIFNKVMAGIGIVGFALLSASGPLAGYATTGSMTSLMSLMVGITYAGGGLLSFVWYILIGLRLLKLGQPQEKMLPLQPERNV